ncbi:MAG: histidine--tRNA ligase [Chloroflexi bacterium]|nr:histidine--tRNA ligase [Chloroflexota bacterium]
MPTFQAPRGMRDLLPAEAAGFDRLNAVVAARGERYGYPRLVTPVVEDRNVFLKSAGATSDAAGQEMYDVTLHGQGGLALRPEGTAAVTRAYLEHGLHRAPQPQRFFYWEPMFRGQRPQLMRWRQFWQWGLEHFGSTEPSADVEIIEFTNGLFAELGLTAFELQLNTIGDTPCRAKVKETLTAYFASHRDALSELSRERLSTNVLRVLDSKDPRDREVVAGAPRLSTLLCDADRAHFAEVTESLERLGVRFRVVETLVRGLDYYTRTVCEFVLTDPEFTKAGDIAVAAGGRYDSLVETLGGPSAPGVGIAGGVDVLYYALKQQGVTMPDAPEADVYVLSGEPNDGADRTQLATPLREAGFRVAIDHTRRSLDKQLESAVKHGARVAVIRGTEESRGGKVIVRDLIKKEQRVTRLAAVVVEVGRHVPKRVRPRLIDEPGAAGETPFLEGPTPPERH